MLFGSKVSEDPLLAILEKKYERKQKFYGRFDKFVKRRIHHYSVMVDIFRSKTTKEETLQFRDRQCYMLLNHCLMC